MLLIVPLLVLAEEGVIAYKTKFLPADHYLPQKPTSQLQQKQAIQ